MARWFEHFFIIPFRWWRLHVANWRMGQQRCKVCGCRDKFDYTVDDTLWHEIVPPKYQNRVVCLACFDDFAAAKWRNLRTSISALTFNGKAGGIIFLPTVVTGIRDGKMELSLAPQVQDQTEGASS